jgi:Enoyl-(Acyl carrier protein) reductase
MCKAFMPLMHGRGWGRIINMASATVAIASPVSIAYRTSKMGVIGFTRALSATLGDDGITINVVLPSLTRTAMTEGLPEAIVTNSLGRQVIHRMAEPEDIAGSVLILAADDAGWITGRRSWPTAATRSDYDGCITDRQDMPAPTNAYESRPPGGSPRVPAPPAPSCTSRRRVSAIYTPDSTRVVSMPGVPGLDAAESFSGLAASGGGMAADAACVIAAPAAAAAILATSSTDSPVAGISLPSGHSRHCPGALHRMSRSAQPETFTSTASLPARGKSRAGGSNREHMGSARPDGAQAGAASCPCTAAAPLATRESSSGMGYGHSVGAHTGRPRITARSARTFRGRSCTEG